MKKFFCWLGIGILLFTITLWLYNYLVFTGFFDKKYTREELAKNFLLHEDNFKDLTVYFKTLTQHEDNYNISFGLAKDDHVNLVILPKIVDPANRILGGNDLAFESPQLDSVLTILGWNIDIIKTLKEKLSRTNCHWIKTSEADNSSITISPNQKAWSAYSYIVHSRPIGDSLYSRFGKPISSSQFGSHVVLNYSSPL